MNSAEHVFNVAGWMVRTKQGRIRQETEAGEHSRMVVTGGCIGRLGKAVALCVCMCGCDSCTCPEAQAR